MFCYVMLCYALIHIAYLSTSTRHLLSFTITILDVPTSPVTYLKGRNNLTPHLTSTSRCRCPSVSILKYPPR
ncbi:uncharacterized protein BDV14DRAFT_185587 [Aspergillus stella-maris]|uniref:uncharacterized protein n=1 Tax=Aspergillus stella-maris TaxID=1810926 RepID=UPI003CCCE7B0